MRLTLRFAIAGFLLATAAGICITSQAPNILVNITILLSPAFLLIQPIWARMPIKNDVVAWWLSVAIVAILNGVLYGMVGAVVAGLLRFLKRRRSSPNSAGQPAN
jgi:hypothetical protein